MEISENRFKLKIKHKKYKIIPVKEKKGRNEKRKRNIQEAYLKSSCGSDRGREGRRTNAFLKIRSWKMQANRGEREYREERGERRERRERKREVFLFSLRVFH